MQSEDQTTVPVVEQKPLTEWANEPSLATLKTNLKDSNDEHNKQTGIIDRYIKNLNGEPNFVVRKGKSKVVPKTIRKQAEWRYAALSEPFLSTDSLFEVEPVTWEDKQAAAQNKLVLNNQMNQRIDKVDFIDEYVRTITDEGTVIVKVGWKFESELKMVEQDVMEMQPVLDNQKAQMMIQAGQEPLEPVKVGTEMVEREVIIYNQPTLEICDYNHVILDPTAKGVLSKAQFVIYRFESTISDLKKDGRYQNLDDIRLDGTEDAQHELDTENSDSVTFTFEDEARKKVWVYEYWGFYDYNETGIVEPFIAAWVGNVKIRMEENPFPDKQLPFINVQYLPVRKKNYGQPDGYLLEENQNIVGAVTRGMIDIMGRSANAQQGVRKDALDVTNSRRFENGEDYKFNTNVDPRQAFHMGTYPEIPNSAMLMINHQSNEAEALTGVKAFSQGITGDSLGANVGNARGALDAASKRELGILRRLAWGIVQIGRKFISMNSEFLSDVEVVRITNEEFVEVRRDDLAGKFDLKLSISTAESDNEKAQELAFMLQTTGPSSDPGETRIIRAEIARLRKMPALAKRIEEYQPQPDPLQQKKAQLEIALLEAQVLNERAKGQENAVDVQLKSAKTQTEVAKTRNLNSTSDQQDLDFVEQDQGIKHNQAIDLKELDGKIDLDSKAADKMLESGDTEQNTDTPEAQDTSFLEEFQI